MLMDKKSWIQTFGIRDIGVDKFFSHENSIYINFTVGDCPMSFELIKDAIGKWHDIEIFHDHDISEGRYRENVKPQQMCPLCENDYKQHVSCVGLEKKEKIKMRNELIEELKQFPTVRLLLLAQGVVEKGASTMFSRIPKFQDKSII